MKDSFLKLILDFIKRYPQKYEGKIGYTFAGSISLNLLSCISGNTINMYSFKDFKLKKIKTLKVDNIFKNFLKLFFILHLLFLSITFSINSVSFTKFILYY